MKLLKINNIHIEKYIVRRIICSIILFYVGWVIDFVLEKSGINWFGGTIITILIRPIILLFLIIAFNNKAQNHIRFFIITIWFSLILITIVSMYICIDICCHTENARYIYYVPVIASVSGIISAIVIHKRYDVPLKPIINCITIYAGIYYFVIAFTVKKLSSDKTLTEDGFLNITAYFIALIAIVKAFAILYLFWTENTEMTIHTCSKEIAINYLKFYKCAIGTLKKEKIHNYRLLLVSLKAPYIYLNVQREKIIDDVDEKKQLYINWIKSHDDEFQQICKKNKCNIDELAEIIWTLSMSLSENEVDVDALGVKINFKETIQYKNIEIPTQKLMRILYNNTLCDLEKLPNKKISWKNIIVE